MSDRYILDGDTPVKCYDLESWARMFESSNRRIASDTLEGGIRVSTVFLGLDHQWGDGPPLLFETVIFGGPNDSYQERYSTKAEALEGHALAVELARGKK